MAFFFAVLKEQNGFIYAKIYGGFDKIRSSVGSFHLGRERECVCVFFDINI